MRYKLVDWTPEGYVIGFACFHFFLLFCPTLEIILIFLEQKDFIFFQYQNLFENMNIYFLSIPTSNREHEYLSDDNFVISKNY